MKVIYNSESVQCAQMTWKCDKKRVLYDIKREDGSGFTQPSSYLICE